MCRNANSSASTAATPAVTHESIPPDTRTIDVVITLVNINEPSPAINLNAESAERLPSESDSPSVRSPDVLVKLQIEAHRKSAAGDRLSQGRQIDAMHR